MIRIGLIALLFAGAAQAQSVTFSPQGTEGCIANGGDIAACVGVSSTLCMENTAGGSSTIGMIGCLSAEVDYWDARLNRSYGAAMQRAKRIDAEARDYGFSGSALEQSLRDMQRAWIPYRDAVCAYERAEWGLGTGAGPAEVACLMHETARQTAVLERGGLP